MLKFPSGDIDRRTFLVTATTGSALLLGRRRVSAHTMTLRIGIVAPPPAARTAEDAAALLGVALGLEEASRTGAMFDLAVVATETAATADDAATRAGSLVDGGATALVAIGPFPLSNAVSSVAERRRALCLDVRGTSGRCGGWTFRVLPAVDAADAAADSTGTRRPTAWLPTLERFGAAQLNDRFKVRTGSPMTGAAWGGWFAVKVVVEAALRARATPADALVTEVRKARFDGHKGIPLSFDEEGGLVQPLYTPGAGARAVEIPPGRTTRACSRPGRVLESFALAAILAGAAAVPTLAQGAELLWVSNEESRDVSVIRVADRRVIARIPLGDRPRGIQASPDGRHVFVALSDEHPHTETGRDAIAVLDARTRRVIARHKAGSDPEQFAVAPDGKRLYAANEDAGTASVTELATRRVLATVVVGIEPEGVAISPDGRWVYVTAETSNSVSVLDTRTNAIVANLLVDVRPRAVAFAPDGRRAWVSAEIGGTVAEIDVDRHEVLGTVELEGGAGKPVGVAVAGDSRRVYVANGAAGVVSVIDARTRTVSARIPVGRRPWGVALSRDGLRLYSANGLSNDVSIIDTRTHRVIGRVPVGTRPWGIAVTP